MSHYYIPVSGLPEKREFAREENVDVRSERYIGEHCRKMWDTCEVEIYDLAYIKKGNQGKAFITMVFDEAGGKKPMNSFVHEVRILFICGGVSLPAFFVIFSFFLHKVLGASFSKKVFLYRFVAWNCTAMPLCMSRNLRTSNTNSAALRWTSCRP